MAGRYCSSNIKFNLDDENQRRTWEYLKESNRKAEGSYAKILSDAFVKVLSKDAKEEAVIPKELAESIINEVRNQLMDSNLHINTALCENKQERLQINEEESNGINEIPAGMLDYFRELDT